MSMERAAAFAAQAVKDENLARSVQSVIANKSGMEAAAAVSALGKSEGYDFSAAEAASMAQDIRAYAAKLEDGKLKEEELAAVAGGVTAEQAAGMNPLQMFISAGAGQTGGLLAPAGLGGIFGSFFSGVATNASGAGGQQVVKGDGIGAQIANGFISGAQSTKDTVDKIFSGW